MKENKQDKQDFSYILQCFGIPDIDCTGIEELHTGHINKTFLVRTQKADYVLQALNRTVFTRPETVMKNIAAVTAAFEVVESAETAKATGMRVPGYLRAGEKNYVTVNGEVWRMYRYIPSQQTSLSQKFSGRPSNTLDADSLFQTGYAFGTFIRILNVCDVRLEQSLDGYHDFSSYFEKLLSVIEGENHEMIQRFRDLLSGLDSVFTDKILKRCIHGDAKADNIIFTNQMTWVDSAPWINCAIIDLDTVMYHYTALDYGDMIRSAVGDADGVKMLKTVQSITAGFAKGLAGLLTPEEIDSLYYGILWVTGELAVRYLTDCYAEEKYFQNKTTGQCMERVEQLMRQLAKFTDGKAEIQKMISEAF